jgi:succinoglycan biosynthesis protein ExoM
MLAACLDSLAAQIVPSHVRPQLVVVDNDPDGGARLVVARFLTRAPFPVFYVHEPRRGIAQARNAGMAKALDTGADWLAMIDDDEVADPDWLAALMRPDLLSWPIVADTNLPQETGPLPFWASSPSGKPLPALRECRTAGGGNVRFHIDLVHAGLRFDERRGLTGGEDTDFFARAHAKGFHIAQVGCAITREGVHPERLTYRGQMYRQFWEAACGVRRLAQARGWLTAALARAPSILGYLLFGILLLAASVPAGIAGPRHFAN